MYIISRNTFPALIFVTNNAYNVNILSVVHKFFVLCLHKIT